MENEKRNVEARESLSQEKEFRSVNRDDRQEQPLTSGFLERILKIMASEIKSRISQELNGS